MMRRREPQDELAGGVPSTVEVDGGDHGLHRVGEDRRLVAAAGRVLALAEQQARAEPELGRDLGEHLGVDDRGAQLGELAFGQLGVLGEHVVGDDDPEHGVAEELEPLVRHVLGVLGAARPVRERPSDQLGVAELEPENGVEPERGFASIASSDDVRLRTANSRAGRRRSRRRRAPCAGRRGPRRRR